MLASQGLDYRTTKKISKPKTEGSLKDFLLASDKQFNIEPDIKPKAPKNHDKNVLVYNGPFGVEHADLLVTLMKACSGEVMGKLEERVRSMEERVRRKEGSVRRIEGRVIRMEGGGEGGG